MTVLVYDPTNICYLLFFNNSQSMYGVVSHCGFDLHFPDGCDIEHLFMCSLVTRMSSLKKCPFKSFAHFFIWLLFYLILSYRSPYIFWTFILCQMCDLQSFSHSLGYMLILSIISCAAQTLVKFDVILFVFAFVDCVFIVTSKKPLPGCGCGPCFH